MRGRRCADHSASSRGGSIPACAGKTSSRAASRGHSRVDPRVCGEDPFSHASKPSIQGRSPRVRGRPDPAGHALGRHGSIPACAGKTFEALTTEKVKEVDPRVCGEDRSDPDRPRPGWGRSPRVRGRPVQAQLWNIDGRSIPACAGKTCQNLNEPRATTVDPRVCGEDLASVQALTISPGRSPRVRGRPVHREGTESRARSIPACAGKTPGEYGRELVGKVDPRVCGEDLAADISAAATTGRSPRVRGRLRKQQYWLANIGSIPACAGKTRRRRCRCTRARVDPRVCGEDSCVLPLDFIRIFKELKINQVFCHLVSLRKSVPI